MQSDMQTQVSQSQAAFIVLGWGVRDWGAGD